MKSDVLKAAALFFTVITGVSCTTSLLPKKQEAAPDYAKQFEAAYEQLQINAPQSRREKQPLVLAHYMPW
ncbi:MAG: hypothetical protein LBU82_07350, partial [Treponema sp.]|nr:hypothetical protein [Treponema sp.]